MLTINEVLKGVWLVHWETGITHLTQLGVVDITFINITGFYYALQFSANQDVITLSVHDINPGK